MTDNEYGASIMEQSIDQSYNTSFTISGASYDPGSEDDCTYWQNSIICSIDFNSYGHAQSIFYDEES